MSYPNNIRAGRQRMQIRKVDSVDVITGTDARDITIDTDLVVVRSTLAGGYTADVDLDELKATTTATLYVSPSGNNGNTGLSWAQAYRSIWKAIITMDNAPVHGPATIYVRAGTYDYSHGFQGLTPGTKSFNLYAVGGRVRATTSRLDLSWSSVGGGTPDVYQASLANAPYSVVDEMSLTIDGLGSRLTLQASVAAVQAAAGSYYHAAGVLYVRTSDSRAPDASLHPFEGDGAGAGTYNMLINSAGVVAYCEGVEFLGGEKGAYMLNGTRLTLVDSLALYCNTEGIRTHIADAYMVRAHSHEHGGDAFAYTSVVGSRAVEVDCDGRHIGYGAAETSNSSSMHNGGVVIRVNCRHGDSKGPIVADVNDSTSINLGCTVGTTRASIGTQRSGFYADGQMTVLDGVIDSTGLAYDLYAEDAEDTIEIAGTTYTTTGGSGTVSAYT